MSNPSRTKEKAIENFNLALNTDRKAKNLRTLAANHLIKNKDPEIQRLIAAALKETNEKRVEDLVDEDEMLLFLLVGSKPNNPAFSALEAFLDEWIRKNS